MVKIAKVKIASFEKWSNIASFEKWSKLFSLPASTFLGSVICIKCEPTPPVNDYKGLYRPSQIAAKPVIPTISAFMNDL